MACYWMRLWRELLIRNYVSDLAAYNNGKLHGVWIDAAGYIPIASKVAKSRRYITETRFRIHFWLPYLAPHANI